MKKFFNILAILLCVTASVHAVSASAETKKIVDHRALALKFERTNKFLNTKFPMSYGAPAYHVAKLKEQIKRVR